MAKLIRMGLTHEYELVQEPENPYSGIYIFVREPGGRLGALDVAVKPTDEGVVVDIYDGPDLDAAASTWATWGEYPDRNVGPTPPTQQKADWVNACNAEKPHCKVYLCATGETVAEFFFTDGVDAGALAMSLVDTINGSTVPAPPTAEETVLWTTVSKGSPVDARNVARAWFWAERAVAVENAECGGHDLVRVTLTVKHAVVVSLDEDEAEG